MTEQTTEATATAAEGQQQKEQQQSTETVDFWKQKARDQEKRAKQNADAAKRLGELEEAQKSETEKAADRVSKAEAEMATIPAKVSAALKNHLVELHAIDEDDADLFLTATEPDLLLKQATRLLGRASERKKQGNHVPREGETPKAGDDEMRTFTRGLFDRAANQG